MFDTEILEAICNKADRAGNEAVETLQVVPMTSDKKPDFSPVRSTIQNLLTNYFSFWF